jgi:predicted transcriptional regulator
MTQHQTILKDLINQSGLSNKNFAKKHEVPLTKLLQEIFNEWLNTKPSETLRNIQCEIIADAYAIAFA